MKNISVVAAVLTLLVLPAFGQQAQQQSRFVWGAYGVRIDRLNDIEKVLRIVKDGRTQITVRDYDLKTELVEITGQQPRELWVSAYSGGAHCCFTSYLFTQEGGLRNILVLFHGNAGMEVKDFDGDGRGELMVYHDYGYFGGLCYACSPAAVSVYRWDGARFYDATLSFPQRTRAKAAQYKRECEEGLAAGSGAEELEGFALGYWANALRVGDGARARSWLLAKMPFEVRRWLLDHEAEIINSASPLSRSSSPTLPADEQ